MAYDKKPSTWLGAGFIADAANHLVSFNTNDATSNKLLVKLTDAAANVTTGDIVSVIYAMVEALLDAYNTQVAASNAPANFSIVKNSSTNPLTGAVSFSYTFTINGTVSTFTPQTG